MRRKSEGQTGLVRFTTHVVGDGEGYFRELAKIYLEGMVARFDSDRRLQSQAHTAQQLSVMVHQKGSRPPSLQVRPGHPRHCHI